MVLLVVWCCSWCSVGLVLFYILELFGLLYWYCWCGIAVMFVVLLWCCRYYVIHVVVLLLWWNSSDVKLLLCW